MKSVPAQSEYILFSQNQDVKTQKNCPASSSSFVDWLSLPSVLWVMVWLGINSGPWVLKKTPADLLGYLHYARTIFPFLVLFYASISIVQLPKSSAFRLTWPVRMWLFYGIIGLISCLLSPRPYQASYWALCYLSVIVFIIYFVQVDEPLGQALRLNQLSWVVTTLFLIILLYYSRDYLFVDYRYGITGYGIVGRVQTIFESAMSRSSGLARFAAVPGIVSFVYFFHTKGPGRLLFAAAFAGSAAMVYFMQSRGAILGMAFSIFFLMLLMGPKFRRAGAILLVLLGITYHFKLIPERRIEQIAHHLTRGQSEQELKSMTGRTYTWKRALIKIRRSPIIGWGQQADRYLIKEHVHNTYLYALLTSGIVGASAFIGGLIFAWVAVIRIARNEIATRLSQHVPFVQAAGILAFFSVRSIPEVCGSMFGVDLMLMAPAIAYLGILYQEGGKREQEQS